jgi:hypothetical protein
VSTFPCPCGGACACHGGNGAFPTPCNIPGGCGSVRRADKLLDDAPELGSLSGLCVLGCADRRRSDVWPRPPRPRVPGQLTCGPCTARIRDTLTEVLELAVNLDLVAAAGSAPRTGDGGRKKIKDEPVAPVPVSVPTAALTDIRSRRGTWVPDPVPTIGQDDDVDDDQPSVEDLEDAAREASKQLDRATAVFGARSDQARAAARALFEARVRERASMQPRRTRPRSIDPRDNDPTSVVGFLDRWTDQVRIGRQLIGAGTCPAFVIEYVQIRTGPITPRFPEGMLQDWPRTVVCGRPTEYRRLVRIEMGARTTGLFAVCTAHHVTRPPGQGDQSTAYRGNYGHRAARGARHGLTYLAAINLLQTHNSWICAQPWVTDYWRGLRELRADLGRAYGEPQPSKIGDCPNGTGETDEHGRAVLCGQPLYASPYSDTIECQRCGREWTHREWRFLGRTMGVIA